MNTAQSESPVTVRYNLDSSSNEAMKKLKESAFKRAIKKEADVINSYGLKAGKQRQS